MATHSNILAWEIPWTEEPGGLWSTGSQSWAHLSTPAHHISEPAGFSLQLMGDLSPAWPSGSTGAPSSTHFPSPRLTLAPEQNPDLSLSSESPFLATCLMVP